MPPSTLFLVLPLLGQPLVTGEQDCPEATAVDTRVRSILGLGPAQVFSERAEVGSDGASLHITLRAEDGRVLGDRLVPADGTCAELAGVAAVILATWLSDVHPEFVGSLPEKTAEPPPKAEQPAPLPPAAVAPEKDSAPPVEARSVAAGTRHFTFGAGFGGAVSSAGSAPFASLSTRWLPDTTGWGWSLSASLTGPFDQALGSGNVQYWRWPLSTGPVLRVALSSTKLDFHAGGALAWLHLRGESLQRPETNDSLLGAALASVRVSHEVGAFEPFAEATGVGWPEVRPYLSPSGREVSLPRFDLYLAVGASLTAR